MKVRKAKKPELAPPPVLLPDLAAIGLKFELPATVVRREEAVASSGDELKQQVCVTLCKWHINALTYHSQQSSWLSASKT